MKRLALALLALTLLAGGGLFFYLRPDRDPVADLASEDPQVVVEAARRVWLQTRMGIDVGPALARGLRDPSPRVRARCLKTLDRLDLNRYADEVVPLLQDPEESVRVQAAVALRHLRGYSDPAPLVAVLKDRSQLDRVRVDVAYSLAERREAGAAEVFATLADDRTEPTRVRMEVALSLGCIRAVEHAPLVCRLARSPEEEVRLRRNAVGALGWLHTQESRDTLLALLQDEAQHPLIRGEAAQALARHGRVSDAPLLQRYAADPKEPLYLQVHSARGLLRLGQPVAGGSDLVLRGLADGEWQARGEAARLAKELRAVDLIDELRAASLRESHPKAKCSIDDALCKLGPEEMSQDPDTALAP